MSAAPSNIEVGQKVPVALVGAELPGGFKIGKAALRGVESHGMLCSETELGMGEDARGIMILDPGTAVGLSLADVLEIEDTVIEFEITPNRPDCMSMIGIAREVAAITGGDVKLPSTALVEAGKTAVERGERKNRSTGSLPQIFGPRCRGLENRAVALLYEVKVEQSGYQAYQ